MQSRKKKLEQATKSGGVEILPPKKLLFITTHFDMLQSEATQSPCCVSNNG